MLHSIVANSFLQYEGATRDHLYFLSAEPTPHNVASLFEGDLTPSQQAGADNQQAKVDNQQAGHQNQQASVLIQQEHVTVVAIRHSGRASRERVKAAIVEVAGITTARLKRLPHSSTEKNQTIRLYLNELAEQGALFLRYPKNLRHRGQAYITLETA